MPSKKHLSDQESLKRMRDYRPMDAAIWEIDAAGRVGANALLGGLVEKQLKSRFPQMLGIPSKNPGP